MSVDWPKLITTVIVIGAATAALFASRLTDTAWLALVGPYAGYTLGQGNTVAQGGRPSTMFHRTDVRTRASDPPPAEVLDLRQPPYA